MIFKYRAHLVAVLTLALLVGGYVLIRSLLTPPAAEPEPSVARPGPDKHQPPEELPVTFEPLPTITVETHYPGANATVVVDTVAAPIEQQLKGVEKLRYMTSRSGHDGTYTLDIVFEPGVDLDLALVLVQHRVSLALPVLPAVAHTRGVTVKKKAASLEVLVVLSSPDGSRDALMLSHYATELVKDELTRLPGVGDVVVLGQQDDSLRVWLDPEKMLTHQVTATEVVNALRQQQTQVAAGQIGQPPVPQRQEFNFTLKIGGRLLDAKQLEDTLLKADLQGNKVRLRDVAKIGVGAVPQPSLARLNGKAVVGLGIYALPNTRRRELIAGVNDRLASLREKLPPGMALQVGFEHAPEAQNGRTTPEYLSLELLLPASASAERTRKAVERCEVLVRGTVGVQDVLALCGPPLAAPDHEARILVRLTPADKRQASRKHILQTLRAGLDQEVPEARTRLSDVTRSPDLLQGGYPIDLAIHGPDADRVKEFGTKLVERLRRAGKLQDVWITTDAAPVAQTYVEVNRAKAAALGVSLSDLLTTLHAFQTGMYVNDFNHFGRTSQVAVQAAPGARVDDLKRAKVLGDGGDAVPLGSLVQLREGNAVALIERCNGQPMVGVTANLAPGVSLTAARSHCEAVAEEVREALRLTGEYRLTWLQQPAAH